MHSRKATAKLPLLNRKRLLLNALIAAGVVGTAMRPAAADANDNGTATGTTAAAAPTAASAADPGSVQQLAPVTVTDQRTQGFAPKTIETGQYRGLDALGVPATVNVVTRQVMDAQGDTRLFDALRNVAGVSRQQVSGIAYDNLSIRGIPLDNRSSYYLNSVLPTDDNIWLPLEDKESVEVLKGAAALYYGFAVPAGIVNMTTKRAGSEPVTDLTVLGDSNGSYGSHVDIGRQFGPDNQFGVRFNAMDEHVASPVDGDHGYRKFFSAALDWRVNSQLLLKYDFEHVETSLAEQAGIAPLAPNKNGVIAIPTLPDPTKLLVDADRPTKSDANNQLLQAEYKFTDDWSATLSAGQSITQRDRWAWVFQKYNVTTGAGTLQASQQDGEMYENKDLRLETNGVFKTGQLGHNVTVGVVDNWLFQPDFTTFLFTANQNLYNPIDITALTPSAGTPKQFLAQHVNDRSVYAFDRIDLTSGWQFVAGLSRSEYATTQAGTPDSDISKTTPSASLSYRLTPNINLYTSYIEALESPGSAPDTDANADQILPAAVSKQEEIGVHAQITGNTLVSLALFNLRQPSAETNSQNVFVMDGIAQYRGIEGSIQGDLTQNLSLTASSTFLDARQLESSDPTTLGKTPENTPSVTASLFADYRVPLLAGLSINGGMYYTGPRAVNDADQASIGGYTLFTAGMRYNTRAFGKRVTLQANLENAFNKRYWSAAGSNQLAFGFARTLELSSTFEF